MICIDHLSISGWCFGRRSLPAVLSLLLLMACTYAYGQVENPEIDDFTRKILDDFKLSYVYLIKGNEKDYEENKKRAAFYAEKGKKASASKNRAEQAKAKDFETLSKYYGKLAILNYTILENFELAKTNTAKICMNRIVEIEKDISKITRKPVERDWLTFDEVASYRAKGYKYKTKDPKIRPFSRENWKIDEEKEAADDKRNRSSTKKRTN